MQTANATRELGEQAQLRRKMQSLNPATGELLAEFEPATDAEVEVVVGNAAHALAEWRCLSVSERASYLFRLKDVLYDRREVIARLVTQEVGKALVEVMLTEVMVVLDTLEYFGRRASTLPVTAAGASSQSGDEVETGPPGV